MILFIGLSFPTSHLSMRKPPVVHSFKHFLFLPLLYALIAQVLEFSKERQDIDLRLMGPNGVAWRGTFTKNLICGHAAYAVTLAFVVTGDLDSLKLSLCPAHCQGHRYLVLLFQCHSFLLPVIVMLD